MNMLYQRVVRSYFMIRWDLWLLCRQKVDYVAECYFLEFKGVELVQEESCLVVCDAYIHTLEQPRKLTVIYDTILVCVLLLKELQEAIEERLMLGEGEIKNSSCELGEVKLR